MKKRNIRKIVNQKENMKKINMRKILKQKKKIAKKMHKKNNSEEQNPETKKKSQKRCIKRTIKVRKFCHQIRQGSYFICTVLYRRTVKLIEHENRYVLTAELYCLVRSFNQKGYICNTCHKHISRNKMSCQAVLSKMSLHLIPDELKDLKNYQKILIFKRIIFKKIAIMHGKGEFEKNKGSICNIPTEAANICNAFPRAVDSNKLIVVKLKQNRKYKGYVYFEPVRPNVTYQSLYHLKIHNKFYEDISISDVLSRKKMTNFSGIDERKSRCS